MIKGGYMKKIYCIFIVLVFLVSCTPTITNQNPSVISEPTKISVSSSIPTVTPNPTATPTTEPSPTATLEPTLQGGGSGKIVYSSNIEGNYEIFIVNADGSGLENLTNNKGEDFFGDWINHGAQIIFDTNRDGIFQIYVMNSDGTNPTNISKSNRMDNFGSLSPDGSLIAFTSIYGSSKICIMNTDGSNLHCITPAGVVNDMNPKWSPDGSKIVFSSDQSSSQDIYVMNSDGSERQKLDPINQTNKSCQTALWLSNNKIYIPCQIESKGTAWFEINPDGSDPIQLDELSVGSAIPIYSPEKSKIAFRIKNNDIYDLIVVNSDGSNQINLTKGKFNVLDIAVWSPDGKEIGFSSFKKGENSEMYIINSEGSNLLQIASSKGLNYFNSWQP